MPAVVARQALPPVLRQDTFWSPSMTTNGGVAPIVSARTSSRNTDSMMAVDSEDEEGFDSPMLGTPHDGHSPAAAAFFTPSFSFSPYLSAYTDGEDESQQQHAHHAFDHGSAVDQKRRSTYLPAVFSMKNEAATTAVPNYARPIRSASIGGGGGGGSMFGTSAQRSRRQQQHNKALGLGIASPTMAAVAPRSPLVETQMPSPTFTSSTFEQGAEEDEEMPVTPPAPSMMTSPSVVPSPMASPALSSATGALGRRTRTTLMSKTLYSLKNASTASFAAVGGPLRGLGMSVDAGAIDISDDVDISNSSIGRARKSSMTRPFSTLFGIKRKKVPTFDMISRPATLTRPMSIQSHSAVISSSSAIDQDEHEEMLVDADSSDDEFTSYARTVYELDAGSRSVDTLRGVPQGNAIIDETLVVMPAVTLEELAHVRASLDALYRHARGPSSASSSTSSYSSSSSGGSKAGSLRSIRRKPVPALINSSPTIPPRSASIKLDDKLPARQHLIRRKNPPPALIRSRNGSLSSGSDISDSAPTLTPTLHSAKSSHSSSSSSSSLDSFPTTPMSMMARANGGQYELDVASILNPDDETSSRPLSGIGLEHLGGNGGDQIVTMTKKSRSWTDRLMRQKSKRYMAAADATI